MLRWTALLMSAAALLWIGGCAEVKSASSRKPPEPRRSTQTDEKASVAAVADAVKSESEPPDPALEYQLPSEQGRLPFAQDVPIVFVNRSQNQAEWDKLTQFWNETTEKAVDPKTGQQVQRKVVKIKVPLGLTQNPPVPVENPLTVAKWALGKRLYFDKILSSDNTVACASCHDPKRGYTDQAPVSTGIAGKKGGISGPTVINSAYNLLQFWDGRAVSLEDQAQAPVQNPVEMFDGVGNAWNRAVQRVRAKQDYVQQFRLAFGSEPTRDAFAKAIACYERTVLSGNSIHDRADLAMRKRLEETGGADFTITAEDYQTVLREAFGRKDLHALKALGLDPEKDAARIPELAKSLANGRALFFGKARCNTCHAGDNFTDNLFHNLGVGADKDGTLPAGSEGRFARLILGHKNPELLGAFKTPTLRALASTAPYMHDGSEKTLEQVIEFYDRGGNANEFLDVKMRDVEKEQQYARDPKAYKGPEVKLLGRDKKPIVPLRLQLTAEEKRDLALFLRALEGDPIDPYVADPEQWPPVVKEVFKNAWQ